MLRKGWKVKNTIVMIIAARSRIAANINPTRHLCDHKPEKTRLCSIRTTERVVFNRNKKVDGPRNASANKCANSCNASANRCADYNLGYPQNTKKCRKSFMGSLLQRPPKSGVALLSLIFAVISLFSAIEIYKRLFQEFELSEDERERLRKKRQKKIKSPRCSHEIPNDVPYLVIGGGTAAYYAARTIRRRIPNAQVLIISEDSNYPYLRPPLSKGLWTDEFPETLKNEDAIYSKVFWDDDEFYTKCKDLMSMSEGGIAVARGWKITSLNVADGIVSLDDGKTVSFEKCLIATGSTPNTLPVFNKAPEEIQDKIIYFRNLSDFENLYDAIKCGGVKDIAIVGGGNIGAELAQALHRYSKLYNFRIHLIVRDQYVMHRTLPDYLSEYSQNKLREMGVNIYTKSTVASVYMKNENDVVLKLSKGKWLTVQKIIVGIGAKPNTDLAESSGLEVDRYCGGYKVNAELKARSNIWVAGDCASFFDQRYGRRTVQHIGHAIHSGQIAGLNMTGCNKPYSFITSYRSTLGPGLNFEAIGVVDTSLDITSYFLTAPEKTVPEEPTLTKASRRVAAQNKYEKGVIFYLFQDNVVGVVLWNLPDKTALANQVLSQNKTRCDLCEIAKLFLGKEDRPRIKDSCV